MLALLITSLAAISQQDVLDLYCAQPMAGVIRVYSRAIKYRDDDGTIRAAQPRWNGNTSEGDRVKATLLEDRGISYSFGLTFAAAQIYSNGRGRIAESISHRLFVGGVKETITLTDPPKAKGDFRVRWRMELIKGLSAKLANNSLVLVGAGDRFYARVLPVIAEDSNGAHVIADLRVMGNTLEAVFSGNWFDDPERVYPVEIDPTVDTDPATAILWAKSLFPIIARQAWFKFSLPTFSTGTTIDSALFKDYCSAFDVATLTINNKLSSTTSWTEASDVSTMEAITTDAGAALSTTAVTAASAWYDHDVTGDAFSGMVKLYAYAGNAPGACTIILDAVGSGASLISSGATSYTLGEQDYDESTFDGYSGANKPYIEITYTGSLQVQAGGSGTGGVLIL